TLPVITDLSFPNSENTLALAAGSGVIAIATGSKNVALTGDNDSRIVDLIGYGSANKFETQPTISLSATTSAKRKYQYDTNNNGVDFQVGSINLDYLPALPKFTVSFDSNGGSEVTTISNISMGGTISEPTN